MDRYELRKGDRIFARLSMGGRTIVEFMMNSISSIREVLDELRRMSGEIRGLGKLYIRNQTRGWSVERGMMMYNEEGSLRRRPVEYGTLPLEFEEETTRYRSTMLSPWQTH